MEANTSVSTFSPTNVNDSNNNTQKLKTSEMAPVYYCECKWKIKRGRLGNEASYQTEKYDLKPDPLSPSRTVRS